MAGCVLEGSFGRKTLVFRRLAINGFQCRVRERATAVSKGPGNEAPSFLSSMGRFFVSLFLFRDFRLEAAEIGEGHVTALWGHRKIEVSGLSGHLNADHLMDIRGGMTVESPSEHTMLSIPDFHIETTSTISLADPQIDLILAFSNGDLKSPQAKVKGIRARASMHYDHGKQNVAFSDLNLTLKGVEGRAGDLDISGPMLLSGTLSGGVKQGRWVFDCNVKGNMKSSLVSYRDTKFNIGGLMTAGVAAQGPVSNLILSGKLTGNQVAFKGKGVSIESGRGHFEFSGTYPNFHIKNLACRIPEIKHLTKKRTFPVERIRIASTQGRANLLKRSLNFPEIKLSSSLLTNILATFQMDNGRVTLTAKGKKTGLIHTASRLKLLPPVWTFQGKDTMEISATVGRNSVVNFTAEMALKQFHFQNPQETCLGEDISLRTHISGRFTPALSTMEATAELSADSGEILMDRFYFDLAENAFFARYNGSYRGHHKHLKLDNLSLGMNKIATAHITGTLLQAGDKYEGELFLRIPDTPLKAPFHRLIREPFQTEKPALSSVRLEGLVGAEMTLEVNGGHWMTRGGCTWKNGALFYGEPIYALTGIQLSLPVWLTNDKDEEETQNLEGNLSVRSMRLPYLPEQGLNVTIQAASNRLFLPDTTTLSAPGGIVRIGPSRIMGLAGPSPALHTALHFDNLQLAPVLSGIWPHPVMGRANGNLDPIHIEGGRLQSTGEIKADIFDGALTLSHVGATGLFTALPVVHLNARWHHLNLAEMTGGTSFGKVEGILNGYAKKLEVSNGQLQRFDLLLDTVKTDDVPQRISVQAVDNIARLGGGQSPFAGVAGLMVSFFKEFPYQKIGVHATLKNDVFRIHGTIREDGKEYLVKRGFFSGVDVINQSRNNRVGFKDMLKRIKRITDSEGGPIIR